MSTSFASRIPSSIDSAIDSVTLETVTGGSWRSIVGVAGGVVGGAVGAITHPKDVVDGAVEGYKDGKQTAEHAYDRATTPIGPGIGGV